MLRRNIRRAGGCGAQLGPVAAGERSVTRSVPLTSLNCGVQQILRSPAHHETVIHQDPSLARRSAQP
jgi:hypothetical protein